MAVMSGFAGILENHHTGLDIDLDVVGKGMSRESHKRPSLTKSVLTTSCIS